MHSSLANAPHRPRMLSGPLSALRGARRSGRSRRCARAKWSTSSLVTSLTFRGNSPASAAAIYRFRFRMDAATKLAMAARGRPSQPTGGVQAARHGGSHVEGRSHQGEDARFPVKKRRPWRSAVRISVSHCHASTADRLVRAICDSMMSTPNAIRSSGSWEFDRARLKSPRMASN